MTAQQPNIIFVLADDMGYGDVGCYNPASKIPTPHLDRLAREGLRFHDAHSCSALCTPSRYGILTGRYCWRTRLPHMVLYGYEPPLIEPDRLTVAGLLQQAGYHTACIGKWHLGLGYSMKPGESFDFAAEPLPWEDLANTNRAAAKAFQEKIDFTARLTGGPTERGFDYFFGTSGCCTGQPPFGFIEGDRFITPPAVYNDCAGDRIGRPGMASPGWDHKDVDIVIARKAVAYIESRTRSDQPFFLYLAPSAPHEPCRENTVPEFARHQSNAGWRGDLVWLFDWVVGQVLAALDRTGQAANTLIIVTSDNGALPGDYSIQARGGPANEFGHVLYGHQSCGDWRGYKSHIWEGGHREPLIVRWPGQVAPNTESDPLVGLHDFLATCAAIVGRELPAGSAPDSVSFLPVLHHPATRVRDRLIHHGGFGAFSVRDGDWKCIFDTRGSNGFPPPHDNFPVPGAPGQLYNLADDPAEKHNLWDERPDKVAELKAVLQSVRMTNSEEIPPDHTRPI